MAKLTVGPASAYLQEQHGFAYSIAALREARLRKRPPRFTQNSRGHVAYETDDLDAFAKDRIARASKKGASRYALFDID